jgi:predicted dinucleotide-binding enzyme
MNGKIVIDATNNVRSAKMHALDTLAEAAPSAKLFRAFNSLGWENFDQPDFDGVAADLFYCGVDDPEARAVVDTLISAVGLRPIRVGGLDQIDIVEGVTRLWFALTRGQGMGRHLAFKVLGGPRA